MPRKGPAPKRPVVADPVYGAPIVSQLVNKILLDGKKGLAERIVYGALAGVAAKNDQDAVATLKKALDNVRPTLEVRSRRVGGLTSYAKARREKTMTERLMNEILDASNGLGAAVKRREDTHKMAEANKAFAHYRW
jgi:small subunit ribosomal protein S7